MKRRRKLPGLRFVRPGITRGTCSLCRRKFKPGDKLVQVEIGWVQRRTVGFADTIDVDFEVERSVKVVHLEEILSLSIVRRELRKMRDGSWD